MDTTIDMINTQTGLVQKDMPVNLLANRGIQALDQLCREAGKRIDINHTGNGPVFAGVVDDR